MKIFQCKHDWKNNLKKNRLIIIDKEKKIFEKMNYYKKTKNISFSIKKKKSIFPFFFDNNYIAKLIYLFFRLLWLVMCLIDYNSL